MLLAAALLKSPVQQVLLQGTNLTGPLPDLVAINASSLITMDLSHTALTGSIPTSWGQSFVQLSCLALHSTGLCGVVPSGLPCFNKAGTNLSEGCPRQMPASRFTTDDWMYHVSYCTCAVQSYGVMDSVQLA